MPTLTDLTQFAIYAILSIAIAQMFANVVRASWRGFQYRERERSTLWAFRLTARLAALAAEQVDSAPRVAWSGLRKFQVKRRVSETEDICSLYLSPHDGKPLPPFDAGQHLTFEVAVPDQTMPVTRCYSLSDGPDQTGHYRITVKRQPDGLVSSFIHSGLQEGDTIDVRAPSGRFHLDNTERLPIVLVAGGIGVTPMIAILNAAISNGTSREIWLFYGVRNRADHAFFEDLARIDAAHDNVHLHIFYSQPTKHCVQDRDFHRHGRISAAMIKKVLPDNGCIFYLCGPSGMMSDLTRDLTDWGVPAGHIRIEPFGASTAKTRGVSRPPPAETAAQEGPMINFARSRVDAQWTADCDVLLDFAERNAVRLYSGCRAGQCGSCMIPILEGRVRHLVDPGVALADGHCLACVAVPETDLVLDA